MPFDPLTAGIEFAKTLGEKLLGKYLPASASEAEKSQFRLEAERLARGYIENLHLRRL